ncbi:MAG: IS66 family insertion sequence element accessory protein TnpB [Nitrococcus sp.]|nr:IS66 family insertion sequence element accessory protein TnpB [Nitrococcus sp.]
MLRALPRLWLCTVPADMRRQYDGLAALVAQQMDGDPLSGQGFVFINRRRTQLKCLYFEEGGYCLWSKRLERGQFARLSAGQGSKRALTRTEFEALIEGLDLAIKRRRKRWSKGFPLGAAMGE